MIQVFFLLGVVLIVVGIRLMREQFRSDYMAFPYKGIAALLLGVTITLYTAVNMIPTQYMVIDEKAQHVCYSIRGGKWECVAIEDKDVFEQWKRDHRVANNETEGESE